MTGLTAAQTAANAAAAAAATAATAAANAAAAAAAAAGAVPGAIAGPVNTATADFSTVQATYNDALAALAANDIVKAQALLLTLQTQVATALASAGTASSTASTSVAAVTAQASRLDCCGHGGDAGHPAAANSPRQRRRPTPQRELARRYRFCDRHQHALGIQPFSSGEPVLDQRRGRRTRSRAGDESVGTVNTNIGAFAVTRTPATTSITAAVHCVGTSPTAVNKANALTSLRLRPRNEKPPRRRLAPTAATQSNLPRPRFTTPTPRGQRCRGTD